MEARHTVVVHLVHGTWPYGLLGIRWRRRLPWFHPKSPTRTSIRSRVRGHVIFRRFKWSGRNSFLAREAASNAFRIHLDKALLARPDAMHVVLAHSHGGTVATKALADISNQLRGRCKVRALICMSTPFAYISERASAKLTSLFFGAIGAFLTSLSIILFTDAWAWLSDAYPYSPFIVGVFTQVGIAGGFYSLYQRRRTAWGYHSFPQIHPSIAVHLVRGTRDEASMTIGLVQSLHAMTDYLYRTFDDGPVGGLAYGLSYLLFSVMGVLAGSAVYKDHSLAIPSNYWIPVFFAFGIGGAVYLASYALVALAAGFVQLRDWPSVVEVDAAPPRTPCFLKMYADMEESPARMRHGIYELPIVQKEIARIIKNVIRGTDQTIDVAGWKDPKYSSLPHWDISPSIPKWLRPKMP
jgi:hypothetical protein